MLVPASTQQIRLWLISKTVPCVSVSVSHPFSPSASYSLHQWTRKSGGIKKHALLLVIPTVGVHHDPKEADMKTTFGLVCTPVCDFRWDFLRFPRTSSESRWCWTEARPKASLPSVSGAVRVPATFLLLLWATRMRVTLLSGRAHYFPQEVTPPPPPPLHKCPICCFINSLLMCSCIFTQCDLRWNSGDNKVRLLLCIYGHNGGADALFPSHFGLMS